VVAVCKIPKQPCLGDLPKDHRGVGKLSPSSRPSSRNCSTYPIVLGLKKSLARELGPKIPLPFKAGSILEIGGGPIEFGQEEQAAEGLVLCLAEGLGLCLAGGFLEMLKTSGLCLVLGSIEGFRERLKIGGLGLVMGTTDFLGSCLGPKPTGPRP
jgi:hypothetical protein